MNWNWLAVIHPIAGLALVALGATAGIWGWRYRRARLGNLGDDVMEMHLMQQHQKIGIAFLALTFLVWLAGREISSLLGLQGIISGSTHDPLALPLLILVATSAAAMLLFRSRSWAAPAHLTLNAIALSLLALQLLSGLRLAKLLFYPLGCYHLLIAFLK